VSHQEDYRRGIRSAVRGLWSGAIDREQFADVMIGTIDRGLRLAWQEGAGLCGIREDEYGDEETAALEAAILSELAHIQPFADVVEAGSKANGGHLEPLFSQAEVWVLRYPDVVNRAKALACADQKLQWVLGSTEEHCESCLKLNGQVRRGSFWYSHVLPKNPPNPLLECGGWRCDCDLVSTNAPASRGRLPKLP
jgi:hypothetical protein